MANEYKNTEKYIRAYGNQVEQEIESRLRNNGKYASGNLYDSIGYDLKFESNRFTLKFVMEDYGKFVDKGVNGYDRSQRSPYSFKPKDGNGTGSKSKFITSLQKWCEIKGIPKGAAFAIRRNIWKLGISPTNFYTIPTTRRIKQFEQNVRKNLILDAEVMVTKEIKKLQRNGR